MASRHRPLLMDVVGLDPYRACVSYWCHAKLAQKKKPPQKVDIEMRSRTRFWSVCTPYWTLGPIVGTPAEGMRVTPRRWQELVDIVGVKSLSGTRF